jgi:hypothetical protein
MMPVLVALVSFACLFLGALTGMFLQNFLPKHHLTPESKDIVKLGAALIATMAALVLGLLVSSAKSSFDSVNTGLTQSGAKFIVLDSALRHYGPEADGARVELRNALSSVIGLLWPEERSSPKLTDKEEAASGLERVFDKIRALKPTTDEQRLAEAHASQTCYDIVQERWALIEQQQVSLPTPFLIVLLLWLTALNLIYGIFAPRNLTVIMVFAVCALSVSGAVFLIFEMSHPLEGVIKASSAPYRKALEYMAR